MNADTASAALAEREPAPTPDPRRWYAAVVLIVAFMLDLINVTIVTVALPSIQRDLRAGATDLEWISAAYLLAFAVALITSARLGDLFGRKRVFLLSIAAFGLTSLACALAPNVTVLIAARVAQGLAAAGIAPQVLSTIYGIFDGRERASVFGLFGIVASVAQALGLVLGGVLVNANLAGSGWRMVFVVSVPIAAVLVVLGARLVPETRVPGAIRPNIWSAGVLTVGLVAVIVPLLEGSRLGWPLWCWLCLVGGVLAVVLLAVVEARQGTRQTAPLLPADLLRIRSVGSALLIQLIVFAAFSGLLLVLTLWVQNGLGYSPLRAGVVTIALCAGAMSMAPLVGRLVMRFGRSTVGAGCVLGALGALALLPAGLATPDVGAWSIVPGLVLLGAGINLIMPPLTTLFMAAVPARHAASASGILSTGQQFAGALGVAVLGALFFSTLGAGDYRAAFTTTAIVIAASMIVCAPLCLMLARREESAST
ncbi:MFS transporter [Actinopolymorpha alba]|uniref:MFS transporter n=1 Tax=Actinopolymorpha alba TaxID=533267 RepID=UPI0007C65D7C|nr:MFS transporter [Actinopolymorpha alba]